ncbi:hypothetical protein L6164_008820 [Bauhinia variegata]|uniref:Uncharacterized protein n=1 Tax=Bauhinia variegata TaxID=167791 RepID=A0ACB9PGS7_BAUVA|nr:hypothetical protein L6164_008820 [Bauhinia variegata]
MNECRSHRGGSLFTGTDPTRNQIVAVEFDTFRNGIDPPETPHLGIDINQIVSEVTAVWNTTNFPNESIAFMRITYHAPTRKLSVTLSYPNVPNSFKSTLSHEVNLKSILPEWVVVGISGCSGLQVSLNNLLSWSSSSELKSISSIIGKMEM